MAVVMILQGLANGQSTPYDGQYLKDFDFEADNGRGSILMTSDLAEAKHFSTAVDAFIFYKTVPQCKPLREDLRPNRPLTATNWEFRTI